MGGREIRASLGDTWAATRRVLRPVRREEWVLLALCLFCVFIALSSGTGLDLSEPFGGYWNFFAKRIVLLFVLTRVAFWFCDAWTPKTPGGAAIKRFFFGDEAKRASTSSADLEFVRGTLILFASLAIYTNVKVRIPFINGTRGDEAFQQMDDTLFGSGFAPWMEGIFRDNRPLLEFFSDVYLHGYFWMLVLVLLFYLRRDLFAIRWTIISVCFVYLIGILMTVAYPSYGPFIFEPERFTFLRGSEIWLKQQQLIWFHNQNVDMLSTGGQVMPAAFAGIAAFPSLHIGHMVVMMMIALRRARWYAVVMLGMTLLTFVATIGFGWHYAVDAIGGILLAAGVTHLMYVMMTRWDARRAAVIRPGSAPPP